MSHRQGRRYAACFNIKSEGVPGSDAVCDGSGNRSPGGTHQAGYVDAVAVVVRFHPAEGGGDGARSPQLYDYSSERIVSCEGVRHGKGARPARLKLDAGSQEIAHDRVFDGERFAGGECDSCASDTVALDEEAIEVDRIRGI